MIDHVTFQLEWDALGYTLLDEIMGLIGFAEIEPGESVPDGWAVRWFRKIRDTSPIVPLGGPGVQPPPVLHFVAAQDEAVDTSAFRAARVSIGLGHICVRVGRERYEACRRSDYLARDSGSGRIWLEYDNNRLRIEVRP